MIFYIKKDRIKLNISFNRVAFIFFIFFLVFIIYSIHLVHLGSRNSIKISDNKVLPSNILYRADIIDRNRKLFKLKLLAQ